VAGSYSFVIQAADANAKQQTAQKAFTVTINPASSPLSITTASPLPSGMIGTPYSQKFLASGGTPPYRWSLKSGLLPQGLTLSSDGTLNGTPTTAGSFSFMIGVTDSSILQQTIDRPFTLAIDNRPNPPSMTLAALPSEIDPTQQVPIALIMSAPYPAALTGTLTISFSANAVGTTDDPMVMFSTGSRTVSFNIPANSTIAVLPSSVLLLAGTVAGTVNLTANVQGGTSQLVGAVRVRSVPPQMRNVVAVRTAGGLRVEITGYSPERRVQRVDFTFRVRTTAGTQSVNLGRSVDVDFDNWYRSTGSVAFGSSFFYVQSFSVDGDLTAIESVTVSLANTQGSTSSNIVAFSN
jgi:hypothetical protein